MAAKKILNIVTKSFRATLEEQDDTVVWLVHTLKANGADVDLLLRGSSVVYGLKGQNPPTMRIGSWMQKNSPRFERDLKMLSDKGISLFYLEEDAEKLGIQKTDLMENCQPVSKKTLPALFSNYEHVWQW